MTSAVMFKIFDVIGTAAVIIWMALHMVSWTLVEGFRLYRSTLIKLKRIAQQTEAEE